jgi:hypothetical protein
MDVIREDWVLLLILPAALIRALETAWLLRHNGKQKESAELLCRNQEAV